MLFNDERPKRCDVRCMLEIDRLRVFFTALMPFRSLCFPFFIHLRCLLLLLTLIRHSKEFDEMHTNTHTHRTLRVPPSRSKCGQIFHCYAWVWKRQLHMLCVCVCVSVLSSSCMMSVCDGYICCCGNVSRTKLASFGIFRCTRYDFFADIDI